MKIGIFTSFQGDTIVKNAIKSCQSLGVDYEVVDITSSEWIHNVQKSDADGFFCPSNCISQELKTIQDERYFFVSQVMHRPIYPDYTGLYIHESKRNMAAWLEVNGYPHAKTRVFTNRKEALDYLENCQYPIVTKSNVGAGASKVVIVKSKAKAKRMAKKCLTESKLAFLKVGFAYRMRFHHSWIPRIKDLRNRQKDYFIVQNFVKDVQHEWRILKIGDSYFGHQKLLKGVFASGSGLVGWVKPPKELLNMVHEICEKGGFACMDVDVFETKDGKYSINELQASFGSYLDYQMSIDGHHGRYVYRSGDFVFEEGDFNVFGSTKLKIEGFIQLLKSNA
jgi:hypothetical protein